jgi:ribosomal protein L30E
MKRYFVSQLVLIDDGESTLLFKKVACPSPTHFDTIWKKSTNMRFKREASKFVVYAENHMPQVIT